MGSALIHLINAVLGLVKWAVIISAVLSWLIAFEVVNTRNRFVYQFVNFLDAVTTPLLRPIRRVIPSLGGVDISPIILILLIQFVQEVLIRVVEPRLPF